MKKLVSAVCASALTAALAITSVAPVNAAPTFVPKMETAQKSDVVQVQEWRKKNRNFRRNQWEHRRTGNWVNNNPRYGWYNGHRGYRYKRPGYRYHDGWWFPAGAFIAGAIVSGAIANSYNQPSYRYGGNAHVEWCYNRYRSYRAYDNTFQPYNGPRRQCYSPYG
ncbi:BA14K family protein [Mesorhizobium sp. VNQ89]|uniref:BA14K family protein n=1 Tax=Mesorhizobium quangtriensis TaxID=3157709 RepID=UPI0032B8356A